MKFVKATCPACGGSLEVADNLAHANCPHCNSKIILDWEGQTSLAVHLDLGKTFLQAGNYREADKHFSLALEKNPRSGDAWFWKAVVHLIEKSFADQQTIFYLKQSGFTRNEMVAALANELEGPLLFEVFCRFVNNSYGGSHSDKVDFAMIFIDAALKSRAKPFLRDDLLETVEGYLEAIHRSLHKPGLQRELVDTTAVRNYSFLAKILLDKLEPFQTTDAVQGIIDQDHKALTVTRDPTFWPVWITSVEKLR